MLAEPAICLVDDDPSVLNAVHRLLKAEGLDAAKFRDGVSFLNGVAVSPCHVVVLDFAMPGMNGLEVQASLRRTSPETRVIFFSGNGDASVRELALENGALEFFTKPVDDDRLIAAVRRALEDKTPGKTGANGETRLKGLLEAGLEE